ncbi:MAG: uncharacterized protein KVP18_002126 [Porospora cf. gigantea A]|uniref:uncharacterized protein n=1 Tax=Porospora cf. gigantea A TaxID=2853593 RepID=UPI00355958A7|nr:MAG: hypothetical protein KVP18_002126 [Porospora cf. gigantea A]
MRLRLEKTSGVSSLVASLKIVGKDSIMMGVLDRIADEFPPGSSKLLQPDAWRVLDPSKVCVPWAIESVPTDDLVKLLHPGAVANGPLQLVLPFSCQARELERRLKAIFSHGPLQFSEFPELMSMLTANSLMESNRWRHWLASCEVRSVVEDGNGMLAAALLRSHRIPLRFISRVGVLSDNGVQPKWFCQKPHLLTNELIQMNPRELRQFLIDYICFLESWYGQDTDCISVVQGGCTSALTTLGCLYLEGATSRTRLHSLRILSALRRLVGEPVDIQAHVTDVSLHLQWAGLVELVRDLCGDKHWLVVGFQDMDWQDLERVSMAGEEAGEEAIREYIQRFLKGLEPETSSSPVASNPARFIRHLHYDCVDAMRSHAATDRIRQLAELGEWWRVQLGQGLTLVLMTLLSLVTTRRRDKALSELRKLDFEENYGDGTMGSLLTAIGHMCLIVGIKHLPTWLLNVLDVTEVPPSQYELAFNEFTGCHIDFESYVNSLVPGPITQALAISLLSVFCWAWRAAFRYVDVATLLVRNKEVNDCALEIGLHPSVLVWPLFMTSDLTEIPNIDPQMQHALRLVLDSCNHAGPSSSVEYLKSETFLRPFMEDMPAVTLLKRSMSLLPLGARKKKTYMSHTIRAFQAVNDAGLLPGILYCDTRKRLMKNLSRLEGLSLGLVHRQNIGALTASSIDAHERQREKYYVETADYLAKSFTDLLPFYSHCEGVVAAQTSFCAATKPKEQPEHLHHESLDVGLYECMSHCRTHSKAHFSQRWPLGLSLSLGVSDGEVNNCQPVCGRVISAEILRVSANFKCSP